MPLLPPARDARQQILEMVAKAWSENLEDLDIIDGKVISYKSEESISLKNIVIYGIPLPNDQGWIGGPVLGRGNFMPTYVTGLDAETGQGPRAVVHYTTGAQAVEVEVDMDTGKVEVHPRRGSLRCGQGDQPGDGQGADGRWLCPGGEHGPVRGLAAQRRRVCRTPALWITALPPAPMRRATSRRSSSKCRRMTVRGGRAASASIPWCPPSRPSPMPSMMPSACASARRRIHRRRCTWRCRMPGWWNEAPHGANLTCTRREGELCP